MKSLIKLCRVQTLMFVILSALTLYFDFYLVGSCSSLSLFFHSMLYRFSSTLNFFSFLTRQTSSCCSCCCWSRQKYTRKFHNRKIVLMESSWADNFFSTMNARLTHSSTRQTTMLVSLWAHSKSMRCFCRTKTCVKWKLEPCHKYTLSSLISFLLWTGMLEKKKKKLQNQSRMEETVDILRSE